jgi:NAD-dependent SIR2 family protein deacetylase
MKNFAAMLDETFKDKRCPYCGSTDVVFFGGSYDYKEDYESGVIVKEWDSEEFGECKKCGATYYKPEIVYSGGGEQLNPEVDRENLWTAPVK